MRAVTLFSALLMTACVTINIYFPAAAAEKAADEIIKGIQQEAPKTKPQVRWSAWQLAALNALEKTLDVLISPAHAEADLAIDSADIKQIRTSMQSRFSALEAMYSSGYIGILADGLLVVREAPISERNNANKLVAAENNDRHRLYQAIANANGHPEWQGQIKATFAGRWVSNAAPGWWYQTNNGSWKQK